MNATRKSSTYGTPTFFSTWILFLVSCISNITALKNVDRLHRHVPKKLVATNEDRALHSLNNRSDEAAIIQNRSLSSSEFVTRSILDEGHRDGWYQVGDDIDGLSQKSFTGWSVAISQNGEVIAVGSSGSDYYKGHVTIYFLKRKNSGAVWEQLGQIIMGDDNLDQFGWSIDLSFDGNTVAISSLFENNGRGVVNVFVYLEKQNIWNQLGQSINGESKGDRFGSSLSLSSDGYTLAIGAPGSNSETSLESGLVSVFKFRSNTQLWELFGQVLYLDSSESARGGRFGSSVSLSANGFTLVVGAPFYDANNIVGSGTVRVYQFKHNSKLWTKQGNNINGYSVGEATGWSTSLSADGLRVAVGAAFSSANGSASGQVRVYQFEETKEKWNILGQDLNGLNSYDEFGRSVSLSSDGSIVVVGAPTDYDSSGGKGYVSAYKYDKDVSSWVKYGESIIGEALGDESGYSVALSADAFTTIIGSRYNSHDITEAGQARIFTYEIMPTSQPSFSPSSSPSKSPSNQPTVTPSTMPSSFPSESSTPTSSPTRPKRIINTLNGGENYESSSTKAAIVNPSILVLSIMSMLYGFI